MKKVLMVFLSACLLVMLLSLSACAPDENGGGNIKADVKKIGIVQIVEHPSLNTIRESMIDELAALGFVDSENIAVDYQNAQGDQTNLKTICQKFANHDYDLIIACLLYTSRCV